MLFEQHTTKMKNYQSTTGNQLPANLKMADDDKLSVYYAPFDYINHDAKIVICGITPGYQQADLALAEAQRQLVAGCSQETAKQKAKETASFGGPMRSNLIALLDYIGVNQLLVLESCELLFSSHAHYVHYTSALRYPVFVDGQNYSGTPAMLSRPLLKQQIDQYLADEVASLPSDCLYIPLGPKVSQVFDYLIKQGKVKTERVLNGLPHPSGANAERISYFLGRKAKENLSAKTNADQIDSVRQQLLNQMAQLIHTA